ncbi:hypothetical protein [Fulvivirga sp. M361]|nr:hypothetical protein [Fulvivirga sp. M361]
MKNLAFILVLLSVLLVACDASEEVLPVENTENHMPPTWQPK